MGQCTSARRNAALENKSLSHCFLTLSVPLVMTDEFGVINNANIAALKLTGYDSLAGYNVSVLMPPEIAKVHDSFIARYRRSRIGNVIGSSGRKMTLITRSKKPVTVLVSVGETPTGFVGALIDITDTLKLKEEETNTKAAVEALKDRSQFISFLNHQLRVPMNAISLGVALLQDRQNFVPTAANPDPYNRHITDMRTSCDQIVHLLNDVLDTERMRANVYKYEYGPSHMAELAAQAKQMASLGNRRSSKVRMSSFVAPFFDANRFWCDGSRMLQVMTSFLDTAIQNAEQDSTISFTVTCTPTERNEGYEALMDKFMAPTTAKCRPYALSIQVWFLPRRACEPMMSDEGGVVESKMNEETKDSAALSYVKSELYTPANREEHVTGLGLLIAREIVEKGHFGSVHRWDEGDTGGTMLEVRFVGFAMAGTKKDVAADECSYLCDHDTDSYAEEENMLQPGQVDVLYVEDDLLNRRIVAKILEEEGIKYTTCENGRFAVEWFKTPGNGAKVIVMDRCMPECNGEQAIRQIRQMNPDQTCVGLTGDAETKHVESMRVAGAEKVLTKPVDYELLKKVLKEELDK